MSYFLVHNPKLKEFKTREDLENTLRDDQKLRERIARSETRIIEGKEKRLVILEEVKMDLVDR